MRLQKGEAVQVVGGPYERLIGRTGVVTQVTDKGAIVKVGGKRGSSIRAWFRFDEIKRVETSTAAGVEGADGGQ